MAFNGWAPVHVSSVCTPGPCLVNENEKKDCAESYTQQTSFTSVHCSLTNISLKERLEKSELPMYGRAAALFPRSLELLHQYDLLHPLAQVGLITRSSVNYDRNGNRDSNRGMRHVFESMAGNTFLDYMLNIRLKYSEEIFQREYERIGGTMAIGWELVELSTEEADPNHPVKATIQRPNSSESKLLAG